jgi:hypothetical protein
VKEFSDVETAETFSPEFFALRDLSSVPQGWDSGEKILKRFPTYELETHLEAVA